VTTIADVHVYRQSQQPKQFLWRASIAFITHERFYVGAARGRSWRARET